MAPRRIPLLAACALSLWLPAGCSGQGASWNGEALPQDQAPAPERKRDPLAFSGRRALEQVAAFTALGPRVPDTPGIAKARRFIRQKLTALGLTPREESFRMETPHGPRTFVNILAERKGKENRRIVWAAHFDTPDFSLDPSYEETWGERPFVGANDGGSGVAVLLELARILAARPTPQLTHQFLFLDGEEKIGTGLFTPYIDAPDANACFGSRAQARRWADEEKLPCAFVLLDMVGDRDLQIVRETSHSSKRLLELFARSVRRAGHERYFFQEERGMVDDHVPFDELGVPSIDLIDFSFGPLNDLGKGSWWHTPEDTVDKLSAKSLQMVGEVCLGALPLLEAEYAKAD